MKKRRASPRGGRFFGPASSAKARSTNARRPVRRAAGALSARAETPAARARRAPNSRRHPPCAKTTRRTRRPSRVADFFAARTRDVPVRSARVRRLPRRAPRGPRLVAPKTETPPREEKASAEEAPSTSPRGATPAVVAQRRRLRAAAETSRLPSRRVLARLGAHVIATIAWIASAGGDALGMRAVAFVFRVGRAHLFAGFLFASASRRTFCVRASPGSPRTSSSACPGRCCSTASRLARHARALARVGPARHWSSFRWPLALSAQVSSPGRGAIGIVRRRVQRRFHGWKRPWVAWGRSTPRGC